MQQMVGKLMGYDYEVIHGSQCISHQMKMKKDVYFAITILHYEMYT